MPVNLVSPRRKLAMPHLTSAPPPLQANPNPQAELAPPTAVPGFASLRFASGHRRLGAPQMLSWRREPQVRLLSGEGGDDSTV